MHAKLGQLWSQGISGSDFFISAIGSAIEIFGKYEKIVDDADNAISVLKLLEDTRKITTDYTIKQIIRDEFSEEISPLTRFYILWRWAYGESKTSYDDAKKLAQSIGVHLENEWNKGFILKEGGDIRIIGPDKRKTENIIESDELIDILHYILILWVNNEHAKMNQFLKKHDSKNKLLRVMAQAINESLPDSSAEKRWIGGFLTGFDTHESENSRQTNLFDANS